MSLITRRRRPLLIRTRKFFHRFRRNTGATFCTGNRVELYRHGGDFFPAMFAEVRRAAHTVCVEFYIIRDDAVGRLLAAELLAAVSRGVTVFVLYDYVGCFDTPGTYFRELERGGVRCLAFNPPPFRRGIAWFDKRDHRKIVVVDGHIAFTGGLNIGAEYDGFADSPLGWRDLGIRIEGPAACQLHHLFGESWSDEGGGGDPGACWNEIEAVAEPGDAQVMIVNGGPHHNRSMIRSAFRLTIAGASECVRIINPYFVPGPRIVRSLLRAARRGVRVQLILPAKNDVPIVRLVSRSYYSVLLKAGIEIYEWQGAVLHAKVMLIDDCWAVIGSANLDQRSFHRNYEVNAIVDSHEFGEKVAEMFQEDLARSRRVVLEEHERRGRLTRLLEWFCAPVKWFL